MILGKKVRLFPTPQQEILLYKSANAARWAYNYALELKHKHFLDTGKALYQDSIRKHITEIKQKEDFKWLKDVSAQIPKQAVKDLDRAYKNFLDGACNLPKYKSSKNSKLSFYNDNSKLKVKKENYVYLEKIGWLKTNEQIPLGVDYFNPRISHDHKYWYISIGLKRPINNHQLTDETLTLDLGFDFLAKTSKGKTYENIHNDEGVLFLEKRLKRLHKQLNRKYASNKKATKYAESENIKNLQHKIQLNHRKISNIRTNYFHHVTNEIVRTKPFQVIVGGVRSGKPKSNKQENKQIQDQALGEFKKILHYKCKLNQIVFTLKTR